MCLERTSVFLYAIAFEPHVKFWRWFLGTDLPSTLGIESAVETQRYAKCIGDLVADRKARLRLHTEEKSDDNEHSDIFEYLYRAQLLTDEELQADSQLIFAAGSDAVRLTIAAVLFYLLKNPATLEKLSGEIRASVTSTAEISDAVLSNLKFLRACVDETLRLTPPKAASIPREVGKGGITIDGVHVPEGMSVGVSLYSLHRDPEIYPEPYAFRPERWLKMEDDYRMRAALGPLLRGPRMCPGGTIAYFAVQLALFHLLHRNDVKLAPGGKSGGGDQSLPRLRQRHDEYQMNDWIIGFADGPVIQLRERSQDCVGMTDVDADE